MNKIFFFAKIYGIIQPSQSHIPDDVSVQGRRRSKIS